MTVFPNPATEVAAVNFYLRSANTVKMEVYNTLGELVQSTTANNFAAGANSIEFNGTNLNKGLYFVNLTIGNEIVTRKVTLK
jgi:flagellar hook assembly protein FlgD